MTKMEVLRDHLADMLAVEQNALQRIERQTRDERVRRFYNAYEMLHKIEEVLVAHIDELEGHLSADDVSFEARLKKTATSIAGSIASIYDRLRSNEPVSRNLRDDYTLLNLAVINYGMLHTTALAMDETVIASLAKQHMTDLTPLIVELSDLIPFVLAGELADEGSIEDSAVAQQAVAQYREAWSHEVTMRP